MSRILLEDTFDFKPDRGRITESKDSSSGLAIKRIPGTLSVCDCVNGNRRRYPRSVWEKNLSEGSVLSNLLARRSSFGLLEHPKDGKVDLTSPISHITVEAKLVEKEIDGKIQHVVEGVIEIVDTVEGRKLAALINAGYDPLVSSRGYGSLITGPDGIDEVQDDFICEGWDVVSTPSFKQAQLIPSRSKPTTESLKKVPVVGEAYNGLTIIATKRISGTDNAVELTLEDGSPIRLTLESQAPVITKPSAPAPSSSKANNQKPSNKMDIKAIRESIQSLKALNPATLDARSFASGFLKMSELHNGAASHLSENASASWEVSQLHKEISAIEEAWSAAFEAPKIEARKLNENQTKLLKVLKGVTAHTIKLRESLTESVKKLGKTTDISEALAKRGRAWMEAARREVSNRKLVEKKYGIATEALDIMAARYKGDVSQIGARVLELEFPNLSESHKKALSEAKTPKAVVEVRRLIEADLKAQAVEEADKKKKADVASSSKKLATDVADAPKKVVKENEGDSRDPVTVSESQIFRQDIAVVGVNEAISMVRRLSQGQSVYHS